MRITKSSVSKAVMILTGWKKDVGLPGLIRFSLTIYAESVADIWSRCQSKRAGGDQVKPSLHDPTVCLRDVSVQVVRRLDCNSYPTWNAVPVHSPIMFNVYVRVMVSLLMRSSYQQPSRIISEPPLRAIGGD